MYKIIEALSKNEKSVLNRSGFGYTRIYYDISDSLFSMDNVSRGPRSNGDKEKEEVKESIFGDGKKLESSSASRLGAPTR